MSHQCSVLVLSCIDFRFQTPIRNFLVAQGLEANYDLLTRPGASKDPDESLSENIALSLRLHQIKEVYVFHHQNCGAYGNSLVSGSPEEREKHRRDLQDNVLLLKKKFPGLVFKTFFARLEGNIEEI